MNDWQDLMWWDKAGVGIKEGAPALEGSGIPGPKLTGRVPHMTKSWRVQRYLEPWRPSLPSSSGYQRHNAAHCQARRKFPQNWTGGCKNEHFRDLGVANSIRLLKVKASGVSASSAGRGFPEPRISGAADERGGRERKDYPVVWKKPLTSLPAVLRFCFWRSGSVPYLRCCFEKSRQEK